MHRAVIVPVVLLLGVLPRLADAQAIAFYKYTPAVIPPTQTGTVLYEAQVPIAPTRMSIDFQPGLTGAPTSIEMRDDGTGGDRQAGDGIWTAQLPATPILQARRADDVQRVAIGFVNVFNGATTTLRGNLFATIYAPDLGTPGITRLSQFVQATSRVVNINDAAYFVSGDLTHVTQEFYRWFGDDYDFLNVIYEPSRFANRTHFQVKNDIEGIGLTIFNNTARYGSSGRLQGISQFPIGSLFDAAETGHVHELGHQWINFLNATPFASGIPHWPLSSMAGGVMGFSIGGAGGEGGNFNCLASDQNGTVVLTPRADAPAYNDLEMYLMGLIPPDQVRTQVVFVDQTQAAMTALIASCTGQPFTGPVTRVTGQDVVARFGPRRPAAGDAPTRFRMATIYVTRDGLATQEEMWLYTYFAQRGELRAALPTHSGFLKQSGKPFYVATGGRATLDMSLTTSGPDFSLVPTPASRTVTAGSPASFSVSAMPQGPSFDDSVKFSCNSLPTNASCSFSPGEVTPGANGRDVVLTIATRSNSAETSGEPGAVVRMGLIVAPWVWMFLGGLRRRRLRLACAIGALIVVPACGGGGMPPPGGGSSPSPNTPAGTYQINVSGTAGSTTRTTAVTVIVQ